MPETPFARPAPDASSGGFFPHFRRALAYAAGALRLDGGFARRELKLSLAVAGGRARRAGMRSCMGPMLRSKVEGDYTISHLRWTTLKRFHPWAYICPGPLCSDRGRHYGTRAEVTLITPTPGLYLPATCSYPAP